MKALERRVRNGEAPGRVANDYFAARLGVSIEEYNQGTTTRQHRDDWCWLVQQLEVVRQQSAPVKKRCRTCEKPLQSTRQVYCSRKCKPGRGGRRRRCDQCGDWHQETDTIRHGGYSFCGHRCRKSWAREHGHPCKHNVCTNKTPPGQVYCSRECAIKNRRQA